VIVHRLLHRLVLYGFHVLVARPVLHGVVGVRYRRRHLVPEGPCLVVSNHNSHLDAAVLMTMFPLRRLARVHPAAAADYFGSSWFLRWMAFVCMNGITIERRPPAGRDPLAPAVDLLKAGDSVIFFPEGSRGEAGVVAPFRRGVGLLVRELPGLLVVPVFLSGPERIWPRGNVLPLPLAIDAHIGRPRTYAPDEDPRLIAARVRADVLALAPPPPPLPGRPTPLVRVAVCGVDTVECARVHRAVTERLGSEGRTLGIGDPVLESDNEGVREATGPIAVGRTRALLRLLAWMFRTGGMFRGDAFVELVERAQIDEALDHARDIRFAVTEGNALVDLLAAQAADPRSVAPDEPGLRRWLRYLTRQEPVPWSRTPGFVRKAPEIWLVAAFDLVRPPVPDVLVLPRVDVGRLMERHRSTGRALRAFENPDFLERLQRAHFEVGALLARQRGVRVVESEEGVDPRALAERVVQSCRGLPVMAHTP
jgi:1-acyl-sn-glycerol-3-phosphate acyltransferase